MRMPETKQTAISSTTKQVQHSQQYMRMYETKQGSCREPTLLKSHLQARPTVAALALSLLQHAW